MATSFGMCNPEANPEANTAARTSAAWSSLATCLPISTQGTLMAENHASNSWFEFTVTPLAGTLSMTGLVFDAKVFSTLTGRTAYDYECRWSGDGFSSALGSVTGPAIPGAGESAYSNLVVELNGLTGLRAAVTFRLDPISTASGNGATTQRRGSLDNIVVYAEVRPPTGVEAWANFDFEGGSWLSVDTHAATTATNTWHEFSVTWNAADSIDPVRLSLRAAVDSVMTTATGSNESAPPASTGWRRRASG